MKKNSPRKDQVSCEQNRYSINKLCHVKKLNEQNGEQSHVSF